jgi:precorrin-8X/cobalt-precorrin-8 methylmutase
MTMRGRLVDRYALPPAEIEALSLSRVRAALGPDGAEAGAGRPLVERMVYAAGDPALAGAIRVHARAVAAGVAALRRGCAIVADVRMVEVALDRARAARLGCVVRCAIDDPAVAAAARVRCLPRALVAMEALAAELDGGVAVVGNAPTALLGLLDLVDGGKARPALIVGTPVGFVAAAEAKEELVARDVPFVTVVGTRGGSAVAAAATNALLRLAEAYAE